MKKKIYIVKTEVIARTIEEALKKKGRVFEVLETVGEHSENNSIGFSKK